MTTLKSLTIVAALLAGGTSLAMAQGPGTGAYPPVAGGAGGNPITNPGYYDYSTGGYIAAPGPGYVAPGRSMYMYAPPRRSTHHKQKIQ